MPSSDGRVLDATPDHSTTLRQIVDGLTADEPRIETRFLYDERGSRLFDRICGLDEYYLTRTELEIMRDFAPEMANEAGTGCLVIEFGSGSGQKTRILLEALHDPAGYVPIDISSSALELSTEILRREYPDLEVIPVCADYTHPFEIPTPHRVEQRRLVYYPGSTIGNFEPAGIREFLRLIARVAGRKGAALIGVDLHKETALLEAAYDDAEGVTAEFELNALVHLNREYGANFDVSQFAYESFYEVDRRRVEMYLVSRVEQTISIGDANVELEAGDRILTEYSQKFTREDFASLAASCGLRVERVWTDEGELFSVHYLTVD